MGSCPWLGWKNPLAQPVSFPVGLSGKAQSPGSGPNLFAEGHLPSRSRKAAYSQASVCKRCSENPFPPERTELEPLEWGLRYPPVLTCPQARQCLQHRLPRLVCHQPPTTTPGCPHPRQSPPGCAGGPGCRTDGLSPPFTPLSIPLVFSIKQLASTSLFILHTLTNFKKNPQPCGKCSFFHSQMQILSSLPKCKTPLEQGFSTLLGWNPTMADALCERHCLTFLPLF